MTAATLKSLTLTAFRGSSRTLKLEFEKNRKLTLIYGENGSGKTTICDSFDFLAKDDLGSLNGKGLGAGLHKYWPAAGRAASDLAVELVTNRGVCRGNLQGSKAVVQPVALKPRVEILRRQQVLKLVEAPPADRYKEVQRFIDIDGFERSEEALRHHIKALTSERVAASNAELQALNTLTSSQAIAKAKGQGDPVNWSRIELAKPAADRQADIAVLDRLRQALSKLRSYSERRPALEKGIADAQVKADASDTEFLQARSKIGDEAERTLDVLTAGLTFLEGQAVVAACPLCESADRAAGLSASVKERIAHFTEYSSVLQRWKADGAALTSAKAALAGLHTDFTNDRAVFVGAATAAKALLVTPPGDPPEEVSQLEDWLESAAPEAEHWAQLEADWRAGAKFVATLREAIDVYDAKRARVQELDAMKPRAEMALEICTRQRQAFTETSIGEIAKEVGRLYEKVHPGEGLDKIAFPLDPKKRASLELAASFGGAERPPQAYFSQSHLDTLGLCVFLALAIRERPDATILVLDDVLGSVDEPHVDRVIEMIYDLAETFQHAVVTTHYKPWREKYRWGLLKPDKPCHFVELIEWGLGEGIRLTNCVPEIDRLSALLAADALDVQAVTSKAGVVLEQALDHLTQKYECSLPRHGRGYTLGELLDAVSGKLRTALRVERRRGDTLVDAVELGPMLDSLKAIAGARNVLGAHFNALAHQLTGSEGITFARQVHALADALVCPEHGWAMNDKSGSYWRNSGDTRRLHPLRKPA